MHHPPPIDYLAKDYQGFRRVMLERMALLAPGWTERSPADKDLWRLSPKLIQLAISHQNEVARMTDRLDDFTNRYSRTSN